MGTPDHYHECSNKCGVPINWAGQRPAKDGKGYVGLITRWNFEVKDNSLCKREYVEAKLLEPLIAGNKYCIKFYTVLADNCQFACDGMGAYLSDRMLDSADFNSNYPVQAQVQNIAGKIIYNDGPWKEICGIYTAIGGEQYISIGNFKSDPETRWVQRTKSLSTKYAYYYIDDVSVIPVLSADECNCVREMLDYNTKVQEKSIDDTEIQKFDINKLQIGQVMIINGVQFDRNHADLDPSFLGEIDLLIRFLNEYPQAQIMFSTYADIEIPENNRASIIEARNRNVLDYIVSKGIEEKRVVMNTDSPPRTEPYIEIILTNK
jgi:outer membrane protein OmpA-like peptidoglycan-associated protein